MHKTGACKRSASSRNCCCKQATFPSKRNAATMTLRSSGNERSARIASLTPPALPTTDTTASNSGRGSNSEKSSAFNAYRLMRCVSAEGWKRSRARTMHSTAPAATSAFAEPPSSSMSENAVHPARCSSSHSGNASMSRTRDAKSRHFFSSGTRVRAARSGDTPEADEVGRRAISRAVRSDASFWTAASDG